MSILDKLNEWSIKTLVWMFLCLWPVLILTLLLVPLANADGITFKFKNPSFSGVGTSAHWLTFENQEKSR